MRKTFIVEVSLITATLLFYCQGGLAQEQPAKSQILVPCKQRHEPDQRLLRGTLGNLSQRADLFSINTGAI